MKRKKSELTASRWQHLLTFLILLHHKARRPPGRNGLALPRGCALAARYHSR